MIFKIGNGNTIIGYTYDNGVLSIHVTKNSSDMLFKNSYLLSKEETINFKEQIKVMPDVSFEFTDIVLGIKFYSGFFREPPTKQIEQIYSKHIMWHLAICC